MSTATVNDKRRAPGLTTLDVSSLPLLLDANQAAAIISSTPKFVRDQCRAGRIVGTKCGHMWRINRDELLKQFGLVAAGS